MYENKQLQFILTSDGRIMMQNDGTYEYQYFLKDHLGSIVGVADWEGNLLQELNYDAWGKRRNANTWAHSNTLPAPITPYGFTGHEHWDNFALINMKGRLYDPVAGRFLSPDPAVQNTEYGPNYNPYSYCLNNPLKYIDPSGFNYDWFRNGITGQYYFNSELTAEDLPDIQAQWGEEWEYEHANLGFMLDNSLLSMRQDAGLMFSPFSADISLMEGVGDGLSISQERGMDDQNGEGSWWCDAYNSAIGRMVIPDFLAVGVGFNGLAGVGGGTSIEFRWVTHSPEASW